MSLSFEDRRKKILRKLMQEEKVEVQSMSELLDVSTETIRRDLERIEKEGKLKKVYGGAIKVDYELNEPSFSQRSKTNISHKKAIAKMAAAQIGDDETIMIDHGTTTIELLHFIQDRRDLTIVTHSLPVLVLALKIFKGQIFYVGGEISVEEQSTTGPLAIDMLRKMNVHKAFISIGGLSLTEGITDYKWYEATISQIMIERAEESIVLADYSKFGKETFAKISTLDEVGKVITDQHCSEDWIQELSANQVQLLVAEIKE